MHTSTRSGVVLALALLVSVAADTRALGQFSRETPLVQVVKKTHEGIVNLKVTKQANWGSKEIVGTGVAVDERGYIVTNAHVVSEARRVVVTFHDKTYLIAEVVAEDPRQDLAILKVTPRKRLRALTFAAGSDLMLGETVIAIGNPFGYAGTVSTGIISSLEREITMPTGEVLTNLTQHTALLNPGNSGGPLFNINGELIGINVALREGAQGIGFALNSDSVQRWLSKTLSASKVSRVSHGLECRELVQGTAADRQKVVIHGVAEGSTAARAGLKKGDVIAAIAGVPVGNRFDVERALWEVKAGQKIEAAVVREGKVSTVAFTVPEASRSTTVVTGGR